MGREYEDLEVGVVGRDGIFAVFSEISDAFYVIFKLTTSLIKFLFFLKIISNILVLLSYDLSNSYYSPYLHKYPTQKFLSQVKRRRKSKAQKSRDRKKAYVEELELKAKTLEAENFRLQGLLIAYRSDKFHTIGEGPSAYIDHINERKKQLHSDYIAENSSKKESKKDVSIFESFNQTYRSNMQKHQEFRDSMFKILIDYPFPGFHDEYWTDLERGTLKDFKTLQKLSKCIKMTLSEFKEENDINLLDELVASLNPNKKQYLFMEKFLGKERDLKKRYLQGIDYLLKAKEIFEITGVQHVHHTKFMLMSNIFQDSQILGSKLMEGVNSNLNQFEDIWGVQIVKKAYSSNLGDCPFTGSFAEKVLKKEQRVIEYHYNHYCFS
ncbi:unnamed protein product [Moneuplotes crassus]|uniref:BZIP domain-containing protein n=1 Tax=Euplotes crassus TaxID=5936 RepID=A0AAD2CVJ0_EUPCR|nr:unnamed protein product [Moneuplotes crassus]